MRYLLGALLGLLVGAVFTSALRLSGRWSFPPLVDTRTTLLQPSLPEALGLGAALVVALLVVGLLRPGATRSRRALALVVCPALALLGLIGVVRGALAGDTEPLMGG